MRLFNEIFWLYSRLEINLYQTDKIKTWFGKQLFQILSFLLNPGKGQISKKDPEVLVFPKLSRTEGRGRGETPDLLTMTSPQARSQLAGPWSLHNSGGRKKGRRAGLFLLLYSLTSYLHRIQLAAFLPQIHLSEGATANGLHYGEFFNGGRSWHRDSVHALPCRRVSSALLLAPVGGLHCRSAQTETCSSRPNPFSSSNSRQLSSK